MLELKPCPFCGGEAEVRKHSFYDEETKDFTDHTYSIECKKCHVKTMEFYVHQENAEAVWNRRVNDEI